MTFACPQCRDTGRVTDRGRFYGDRDMGQPCPDCATRQNHEQANAEMRARIAQRYLHENRIDELRRMYPDVDEAAT